MDVAALVAWVITALGGSLMLGIWLRGGARQPAGVRGGAAAPATSRLPRPVVFGHFLLAATGLVLWIIYVVTDARALAWISFVLLLVVAVLGFTLFSRWSGGRAGARDSRARDSRTAPEDSFPLAVVVGHGLFAVVTVVFVLLAALEVGGS